MGMKFGGKYRVLSLGFDQIVYESFLGPFCQASDKVEGVYKGASSFKHILSKKTKKSRIQGKKKKN